MNTASETLLVDLDARWRFFKGTEEPPTAWKRATFDDATWLLEGAGNGGIGYGACNPATVLTDMQSSYWSVYTRFKLDLSLTARPDAWKFNSVRLRVDADDGYVAYFNEQKIGSYNMPVVEPVPHDTAASTDVEANCAGGPLERIQSNEWDSFGAGALILGTNVLAVQIHNKTLNRPDLVFRPQVFAYKRGPFVALGSPRSTHIAFNTLDNRKGRINYGMTEANLNMTATEPTFQREHDIELSSLIPGITYYYKVFAASEANPNNFEEFDAQAFCFDTPGEGTAYTSFNFVAFGDCGGDKEGEGGTEGGTNGDHQDLIANLLPTLNPKPDFCLVAGDVIYEDGQRQSFDRRHFFYYRNIMPKKRFYQVLGNHDVSDVADGSKILELPAFNFLGGAFAKAFVLPTNGEAAPAPGNPDKRELYYSFDWGIAHIVVLDATIPGGTNGQWNKPGDLYQQAEKTWAENDLQSSTAFWKIVCFHHPPYTYHHVGANDGELKIDKDEELRMQFGNFFEARKVDLVITAHVHLYERTFPLRFNADNPPNPEVPTLVNAIQEPNYIEPGAPIYVVTGGGGKDLDNPQSPQPVEVGGSRTSWPSRGRKRTT